MAGSAMGAVAGVLITPRINFDPISLTVVVIDAFTAALIGRLTSLPVDGRRRDVPRARRDLSAHLLVERRRRRRRDVRARAADARGPVPARRAHRAAHLRRTGLRAGPAADNPPVRRAVVAAAIGLGIVVPLLLSSYYQSLAAYALIVGLIVLSLVVLTGLVGQISFCQYSFAAIGAFTVGSLVGGHGWSFWPALLARRALLDRRRRAGRHPGTAPLGPVPRDPDDRGRAVLRPLPARAGDVGLVLGRHLVVDARTPELPRHLARRRVCLLSLHARGVPRRRARGVEPAAGRRPAACCGRSATRRSRPRRAA